MRRAAFLLASIAVLAPAAAPAADDPAPPEPSAPPSTAPTIAPSVTPVIAQVPAPQDPTVIEGRVVPGLQPTYPSPIVQTNPGAVNAPAPDAFPTDQIPVPDRWRLAADLGLVKPHFLNPYN